MTRIGPDGEAATDADPDSGLTIGEITYANVTPIFQTLKGKFPSPELTFRRGVPAVLNGMLSRGEIDLCPSSSVVYARSPEKYLLIPDLSISSIGPVKSVLLFSRIPLENLAGRSVGLTAESETSVILLRIILGKFFGVECRFERISGEAAPADGDHDAFLLIGNAALRAAMSPGDYRVYDLGELWYRFTGSPFVFALWIVRRDSAERKGAAIHAFCETLRSVKRLASASLPEIARAAAVAEDMDAGFLLDYWKYLCYDLGPEHRAGLRKFYSAAAELGLLPPAPELHFV
jgi:chorismate dehydratase